jgi:hypothetical protein
MSKKIPYQDVLKNKLLTELKEFEELNQRKIRELSCPSCEFIDQEPMYSDTCSNCGHIR